MHAEGLVVSVVSDSLQPYRLWPARPPLFMGFSRRGILDPYLSPGTPAFQALPLSYGEALGS